MFGAMVPDMLGIFRLRKLYRTVPARNEKIQRGIELHARTNAAFDENLEVKELEASLAVSFKTYLPKWTALQCARVGKDILFDGLFFKDQPVLDSYNSTMALATSGAIDFMNISDSPTELAVCLRQFYEGGLPRYDDPAIVAERLQKRLVDTRTPVDPTDVPGITATFLEHQSTVFDIGQAVVSDVVALVRTAHN